MSVLIYLSSLSIYLCVGRRKGKEERGLERNEYDLMVCNAALYGIVLYVMLSIYLPMITISDGKEVTLLSTTYIMKEIRQGRYGDVDR